MKHDQDKESYYVGMQDPTVFRRSVLELAKTMAETVHMHSRVRDIQDDKLRLRTELAHVMRAIHDDLNKLEEKLPKRELNLTDLPQTAKRRVVSDHRLDKIEAALTEIEARMKSL